AIAPLRAAEGDRRDRSLLLENEIGRHMSRSIRSAETLCKLLAQPGVAFDPSGETDLDNFPRTHDRHRPACAAHRGVQNLAREYRNILIGHQHRDGVELRSLRLV